MVAGGTVNMCSVYFGYTPTNCSLARSKRYWNAAHVGGRQHTLRTPLCTQWRSRNGDSFRRNGVRANVEFSLPAVRSMFVPCTSMGYYTGKHWIVVFHHYIIYWWAILSWLYPCWLPIVPMPTVMQRQEQPISQWLQLFYTHHAKTSI